MRALRFVLVKVPKPMSLTSSPLLTDLRMIPKVASNILSVWDFVCFVSLATRSMSCALFILITSVVKQVA